MMKTMRETTSVIALGSPTATDERDAVKAAFQEVQSSFENFCLLVGIEAFQDLLEDDSVLHGGGRGKGGPIPRC